MPCNAEDCDNEPARLSGIRNPGGYLKQPDWIAGIELVLIAVSLRSANDKYDCGSDADNAEQDECVELSFESELRKFAINAAGPLKFPFI